MKTYRSLIAMIGGFTPLPASMPAEYVVAILAAVVERFESVISHCGSESFKFIQMIYMVAIGVSEAIPQHGAGLVRCAFYDRHDRAVQCRVRSSFSTALWFAPRFSGFWGNRSHPFCP